MGLEINLLNTHPGIKRDYDARAREKTPELISLAKEFGKDFFDGDRKCGYGGYKYDGRWQAVVERLQERYSLPSGASILDNPQDIARASYETPIETLSEVYRNPIGILDDSYGIPIGILWEPMQFFAGPIKV